MDIKQIVSKMELVGVKVYSYNSFGIIYVLDGQLVMLKLTYHKNKVTKQEIKDFDNFDMNEYFIYLTNGVSSRGVYVGYKENDIVLLSKVVNLTCYNEDLKLSMPGLDGESKVILYRTLSNKLYIVNYKGKKVNITSYLRKDKSMRYGILYNKYKNRYIIGYESMISQYPNDMINNCLAKPSYIIADVDEELQDINFHK